MNDKINTSENKEKKASKIDNIYDCLNGFFEKYWAYIIIPFLIIVTFFATLKYCDVYPFNPKTTMSNYDLLAQICPYLEHFYDVISGKSSLFYTTSIVGGADIFQTLAYSVISPFNWIFLLFGHGNVYYGISIVLPIKLVCIAESALFFIKRYHKNVPDLFAVVLSLLYAYCGYTFTANTFIDWLDFLIYLPFVVSGFSALVKEGKYRKFIIFEACMLYTCFSIACFSLILMYVIMVLHIMMNTEKKDLFKKLTDLVIALVITVLIAAPLLIPVFISYTKCGRNTGLFTQLFNPLDLEPISVKSTYIIAEGLLVFCTIYYFIKNGLKTKYNRSLLYSGFVVFAPVFIDEVCLLLNGGSYYSYALRFGFLSSFYTFYLSVKLFDDKTLYEKYPFVPLKQPTPKEGEKKLNSFAKYKGIIGSIIIAVVTVGAIIALFYISHMIDTDGWKDEKWYTEDFDAVFVHSVGGFVEIFTVFAVIFFACAVFLLLIKFKFTGIKFSACFMAGIIAVQLCIFNSYLITGNLFSPVRYRQFEDIKSQLDEIDDDDTYRLKDYQKYLSNNAPLTLGTNSFSVFSSNIDERNFSATRFFGYFGNNDISVSSASASANYPRPMIFADCIMGYKYYVVNSSKDDKDFNLEKFPYLGKLDIKTNYYSVYKNLAVLPNAIVTSNPIGSGGTPAQKYEALYLLYGGNDGYFDESPIDSIFYDETNDAYKLQIYKSDGGWVYLECNFPEEYDVYVANKSNIDDFNEYKTRANDGLKLNAHNPSTTVYLKNYSDTEIDKTIIDKYIKVKYLSDMNASHKMLTLSDTAKSKACKLDLSAGKFATKAYAENEGEYLFMNYVALDGHEVYVNGKKVTMKKNFLDFMEIPLEKGENDVKIVYKSPYPRYSLIIMVISAILVTAIYLLRKKTCIFKKLSPAIAIASIAVWVVVVALGLLFPTGVFLAKLFKII